MDEYHTMFKSPFCSILMTIDTMVSLRGRVIVHMLSVWKTALILVQSVTQPSPSPAQGADFYTSTGKKVCLFRKKQKRTGSISPSESGRAAGPPETMRGQRSRHGPIRSSSEARRRIFRKNRNLEDDLGALVRKASLGGRA